MNHFGSEIVASEFPDDDGLANPELMFALEEYAKNETNYNNAQVIAALGNSPRLLIPVVAQIDTQNDDGTEKDSSIMSVTFESSDGRIGLPVFSGIEALAEWDPEARPIPRTAKDIARSCLAENFDAMLLDMGSSHRFVIAKSSMEILANLP